MNARLKKAVITLAWLASAAFGFAFAAGLLTLLARAVFAPTTSTPVTVIKDVLQALQAGVTVIAVMAGGYWFLQHRRALPRLDISHQISHENLSDDVLWLRVVVRLENKGEVLVKPGRPITGVRQVLPLTSEFEGVTADERQYMSSGRTDIVWKKIRECSDDCGPVEIEPGEPATVEYDFLLPKGLKVLIVYTFVPNLAKLDTQHGWPVESIYKMADAPEPHAGGNDVKRLEASIESTGDSAGKAGPNAAKPDEAGAEDAATDEGEQQMKEPPITPQTPVEPQNTIKPEPAAPKQ